MDEAILVGGGAVGVEHHLPRMFQLLAAQRVCIVEPSVARRAFLTERFQGFAPVEVMAEVPKQRRFDFAVIATPPRFHRECHRQLAAQCGRFLIEKPLALTAADAAGIAEIAGRCGHQVWVNLLRRSLSSYALLRRLLAEQRFGPLQRVRYNEGDVFNWQAVSLGSFSKALNGGGVLMDTGPHALDLLLWVLGELRLCAAWTDAEPEGVEANCLLELEMATGVPVIVQLSRNRRLSNTLSLEFAQGSCRVPVRAEGIEVRLQGREPYWLFGESAPEPVNFAGLFDRFYQRFCLVGNTDGVGIAESLRLHALIDASYAAARPMKAGF